MRRFLALLLCCLAWPAVAVTPSATAPVLVLGDSLSAAHNIPVEKGWVRLLDVELGKIGSKRPVVNASISGETSAGGLARLPDLIARHHPGVVVLELGANDGLRGLSLDALRDNLGQMIVLAQRAGARVLLLGIELPVNYGPRYRDGLRAVYVDLATEYHAALVPFLLDGVALDPALMQPDGLHPNATGEPRVFDNVWPVLQPLL